MRHEKDFLEVDTGCNQEWSTGIQGNEELTNFNSIQKHFYF